MRFKTVLLATLLSAPLPAMAQNLAAPSVAAPADAMDVNALRDAALSDDLAYDITEGLTTEIGARLAGTEAEARARAWAVKKLTALGFQNVRIEPFQMKTWVRGKEEAEILAPFPQKLHVTALGNSGATKADGLVGDIVYFPTLDALKGAADGSLKGKIAFVSHSFSATDDGAGYGQYGAVRRQGPAIAAAKGAAAILIRSIGTDYHRNPHAGGTSFDEGTSPIPAGALSLPDADQLVRVLKRGKPVSLRLLLTPRVIGTTESGNVVAEVPGSDPNAGIVLIGGHLDSWDLATGAFDDAGGLAITTAAAKRIMDAGQPRRTIRVVWFGAEEVGVFGGSAYHEAHRQEYHAIAAESDGGPDRILSLSLKLPDSAKAVGERLTATLADLGITTNDKRAGGGADVGPVIRAGSAAFDLNASMKRYFDYHHTPDDTLDKVDLSQMRQAVAAWTAALAVVANAPEEIPAMSGPSN